MWRNSFRNFFHYVWHQLYLCRNNYRYKFPNKIHHQRHYTTGRLRKALFHFIREYNYQFYFLHSVRYSTPRYHAKHNSSWCKTVSALPNKQKHVSGWFQLHAFVMPARTAVSRLCNRWKDLSIQCLPVQNKKIMIHILGSYYRLFDIEMNNINNSDLIILWHN